MLYADQSEEERQTAQQKIEIHLQRRLSCRPTVDELRQKNILRDSDNERKTEKLKSDLSNKVSISNILLHVRLRFHQDFFLIYIATENLMKRTKISNCEPTDRNS